MQRLRSKAQTMRNYPQILPITTSTRRPWTHKALKILALATSHPLEWLAGSTWILIMLLVILQPSAFHMMQPKINLQAVIFLARLICRKFRAVIRTLWLNRQRRQPPRRQGRHESPQLELPRHGQGPRQS
jgi:hypothetical protein